MNCGLRRCLVAFGGNQGNVAQTFARACRLLNECGVAVEAVSSHFRTAAMGENAGCDFLNAAAVVGTALSPDELLTVLHQVEDRCGRRRTIHWGPRTLDLDLLLDGTVILATPQIVIPHPALWYRRFVLAPAAEIAGEMLHPLLEQSILQLWQRLQVRPLIFRVIAAGGSAVKLSTYLRTRSPDSDLDKLERLCDHWNRFCNSELVRFVADGGEGRLLPSECSLIEITADAQKHPLLLTQSDRSPVDCRRIIRLGIGDGMDQSVRDLVRSAAGG